MLPSHFKVNHSVFIDVDWKSFDVHWRSHDVFRLPEIVQANALMLIEYHKNSVALHRFEKGHLFSSSLSEII